MVGDGTPWGVAWDAFDVAAIRPSSVEDARARFQRQLPELIWNAARLEGNSATLPKVRALLEEGVVSGRRTDDEKQILALGEGYNALDEMVGAGTFSLSKAVSDRLHGLVAVHEAIESGHFRGEGSVTGGGTVRLARGGTVPGVEHGQNGALLRERFEALTRMLAGVDDARIRALVYFAAATRTQFYFDGNKRTARLMMSGILMSHGYGAINTPYARRRGFNQALDTLFATDNATELATFLVDCATS